MTKQEVVQQFEEHFLPLEMLAKERFDYFLQESPDEKANEIITMIRDDEIRHIELCKKVIAMLK